MTKLKPPSKTTLSRYGLTRGQFYAILRRQKGVCPICKREFTEDLRPDIDHEHVKNFMKLPKSERSVYVRGLLCRHDNWKIVPKGMTTDKAYNAYKYLLEYDKRRNSG